jgi:hypothetical protein
MDGMNPSAFEAAPLRYVHDAVTGEFVSLGVVLLCPERRYLGSRFLTSLRRVKAIFPDMDWLQVRRICEGLSDALADARQLSFTQLPLDGATSLAALLGRLAPPNDGALQFPSVLATGITVNPERTLNELFERYTARHRDAPARVTRADDDVWAPVATQLRELGLLRRLQFTVLKGDHRIELQLKHAWQNGSWNAVHPVSLDLAEPREIRDRAMLLAERVRVVRPLGQGLKLSLLVGEPSNERPRGVREAATDAMDILTEKVVNEAELVLESQSRRLVEKIAADLSAHPT